MTKEEYLGYMEVALGVKEKGWHCTRTDKSSQLVLNTLENYRRSVLPHTVNDYPSSLAEVTSSEGILYDQVASLVKIFGIGRAHLDSLTRLSPQ